jgi:uncharacterized membrane protein YfcA
VTPELVYACLVVFAGYLVLGVIGFGSALVIVPLLSWLWPLTEVVLLVLLLDIPASVFFSWLNLKHVDFGEIGHLLPGMLVGSLLGFWLQGSVSPQWPLLGLGVYITAVGVQALARAGRVAPAATGEWRAAAGVGAGLIEVMFATAGPVVLAWLQKRLGSVHAVRATTPTAMAVCASAAIGVISMDGALANGQLWQRWLGFLAISAIGVVLGNRLARHVRVGLLAWLVCAMLVASGASLAVRSLV